jgi:hypothetical protein
MLKCNKSDQRTHEHTTIRDGFSPMTRAQRTRLKALFLKKFAEFGIVTHAAEGAGIDRRLYYKWMDSDKKFRLAFEETDKQFTDSCIKEAVIRGRDGRPKPIVFRGEIMGRYVDQDGKTIKEDDPNFGTKAKKFIPLTVLEYSDPLLIFLIKARRPEYRESHRQAIVPPTDGAQTADQMFSEIDARAKAAQAPKSIEEAQIVEPDPPHESK